ncbi:MAG: flagella basal body P-ring formation protein FlgA [Anaerolineae bacterium]|nr:flagella basal body P-ring formation protein FlgA [Anaerolineae bacterium]
MRLRTFLLLIGVLVILAIIAILVFANLSGDGIAGILPGGNSTSSGETDQPSVDSGQEPGVPTPTATPAVQFESVVIAERSIPAGERLREDLLVIERRPTSNIALQGGYTFTDTQDLIGDIVKTNIAEGQAILAPMIALNPTDLAASGSDISLYIDQGRVAIAFPINQYSGAAFAMRPGDKVDVLMSLPVVELDPEFNTKLPNVTQRVDDLALAEGRDFLFPDALEGRLELIEPLNLVGEVSGPIGSDSESMSTQVSRRITQLTIQQAEVIWVGTWQDPLELERQAARAAAEAELAAANSDIPVPTPTPLPSRLEATPDVVILSLSAQDALALKWSLERGVDIDLVLRSPGDTTVFATNSVSLPVLVDNGALRIPEKSDFDIDPSMYKLEFPTLDKDETE